MKVYLIFFGSSQGFTSYFFDRDQVVQEPEKIFKDLELLEPKYLNTDSVDNKEILSRYRLTSGVGNTFSLVKLFSFAQAYNIPRIEGCLYGVALLSDGMISLSKRNLSLLKAAKDNFAKLCLNGLKFRSSDFFSEAKVIWQAIVTNEKGNLLDALDLSTNSVPVIPLTCAYKVDKLFEDAILLDTKSVDKNFVYFSEDLAHLRRTQVKYGASNFPIYLSTGTDYHLFQEPQKLNTLLSDDSQLPDLQKQIEKITSSFNELKSAYKTKAKLYRKRVYTLGFFALCLLFSNSYLIFKSPATDKASTAKIGYDAVVTVPVPQNDTSIQEYSAIYLTKLFSENPKAIDTFSLLLQDFKALKKLEGSKKKTDSLIYFGKLNNFKRRANYLELYEIADLFK